ncbi:MAG: hypothetical protein Q9218_004462, partial [Villophora microphyllina]
MTGYKNVGQKNPETGAVQKEQVEKIIENAPKANDAHIRVVTKRPRAGVTAIHGETNRWGAKMYTAYLGSDDMLARCGGMMIREKQFPNSRDVEYRPSTEEEKAARRKETLSRAPTNPKEADGNPLPAMNEEKPPATAHLEPVWLPEGTDNPLRTIIKGTQAVSSQWDGPLMNKLAASTKEARQDGQKATMRYRSNPTKAYIEDIKKDPELIQQVKGPSDNAYISLGPDGKNYALGRDLTPLTRTTKAIRVLVEVCRRNQIVGLGNTACEQTRKAVVARKQAAVGARNEKLDAQYEQYVEAYDAVRANATHLITPFIEGMVKRSNSNMVWAAAWEIMSLADPEIIVLGGPVSQGMHSSVWVEDNIANKIDNKTMSNILAIDGLVIDSY